VSQGEYIEPEVIEKAFALEEHLREPVGPYLNQPNPYAEKGRHLKWLVPLLVVASLINSTNLGNRAAHKSVLTATYNYQAGVTNPIALTEPFESRWQIKRCNINLSAARAKQLD